MKIGFKMKIRFNEKYLLDEIIWCVMLFEIMFGNLLHLSNSISVCLLFLIFISCIKDIKLYTGKQLMCILSFVIYTMIFPIYNFLNHGGSEIKLMYNVFAIVTPAAMLLYITKSCSTKENYIFNKLFEMKYIINAYAIANIVVMILQIFTNRSVYSNKTEYWDSISGLFGKYGTPAASLFVSFVVAYDYIFYKYAQDKKLKSYIWFIVICNFLISAFNDNKTFYLILPVFMVCTQLIIGNVKAIKNNTLQRYIKFFFKICLAIVVGISTLIILGNIPFIRHFYNQIEYTINLGWKSTNMLGAEGSSERFGMISYALNNPNIRDSGYGIGRLSWKEQNGLGFVHFGISDIGTFFILGGWEFIIVLVVFVWISLTQLFKGKLMIFSFTFLLIALGVYTQLFTEVNLMGCIVLYLSICWCVKRMKL